VVEDHEARAALARNVLAVRHKAGMTQADLADRAGIAQQKVSSIELGTENVTLRTLTKLATALQVDVAALLRSVKK
jgi:transcriptional regulator with XRE-family HTH domain